MRLPLAASLLAAAATAEDWRWLPEQQRPDPVPVAIAPATALSLPVDPAFELLPGGALAWRDRSLELHPYALVSGGWDGNPAAAADPHPGPALSGLLGADMRAHGGDRWRLQVRAQAEARTWPDGGAAETRGGAADGRLLVRGATWWLRPSMALVRTEEPLAATALAVPRRDASAAVAGGREGRRTGLAAQATWRSTAYLADAPGFIAAEEDADEIAAEAAAWLTAWSRSELGLKLGAAERTHPHGGSRNDGRGLRAATWWRHQWGDRTWITAEAGAAAWRWSGDTAGLPANDDARLVAGVWSLRGEWRPEERSRLLLRMDGDLGPGAIANYAEVLAVAGSARLRLLDRSAAVAEGRWERRADGGAQPGLPAELRRNATVRAGFEHELRDGLAIRLLGGWDESRARVGTGYQRPGAFLELAGAL